MIQLNLETPISAVIDATKSEVPLPRLINKNIYIYYTTRMVNIYSYIYLSPNSEFMYKITFITKLRGYRMPIVPLS